LAIDALQVRGRVHPIKFDTAAGWNTGFRSCAEWLSWRVGSIEARPERRSRRARAGTLAQALARATLVLEVRALNPRATSDTKSDCLPWARAGPPSTSSAFVRGAGAGR